jgi:hypothetical protein
MAKFLCLIGMHNTALQETSVIVAETKVGFIRRISTSRVCKHCGDSTEVGSFIVSDYKTLPEMINSFSPSGVGSPERVLGAEGGGARAIPRSQAGNFSRS